MNHPDSALLSLLSLSTETTTISSSGGGGCSSAKTSKLTTTLIDGTKKHYFLKTGSGPSSKIMFEGEHLSLNSINSIVPSLCPKSYGHGALQDPSNSGKYFLVTDFLDLSSRSSSTNTSTPSLAQKLAKLHTTPAPIPPGFSTPQFGFPVPTCCGDTAQSNTFSSSWADFYVKQRLRFILAESIRNHGKDDPELSSLVQQICSSVIPNLIGDTHLNSGRGITPVVVHGDLWSGNTSNGKLPGMEQPEDVIYDSSASYAHSEFELGIMKMFGGFGPKFLEEYHTLVPKTEPVEEYEDRVKLYELYHHLNHYAMFGGGYRSGAMAIMKDLIGKYGRKA